VDRINLTSLLPRNPARLIHNCGGAWDRRRPALPAEPISNRAHTDSNRPPTTLRPRDAVRVWLCRIVIRGKGHDAHAVSPSDHANLGEASPLETVSS